MPCKVYNCLKMLGTTSNVPSINTVSQFVKISKNFLVPKIKILFSFPSFSSKKGLCQVSDEKGLEDLGHMTHMV